MQPNLIKPINTNNTQKLQLIYSNMSIRSEGPYPNTLRIKQIGYIILFKKFISIFIYYNWSIFL
jgi:hypothetical protein